MDTMFWVIMVAFNGWILYTSFKNGQKFRQQMAELKAPVPPRIIISESIGRFFAVFSMAIAIASLIRGE